MTKSVGFLKKLKKLGQLVGKGASWVNKNVVKPLNPIVDTALDFVPYGNTIKEVKNTISKGIDRYLPSAPSNKYVQKAVQFGADVALDTQRSKNDQKYINFDNDYDDSYDEEEYIPPPKKSYSNPFGKRIN